jgi:hypothetical protein
MCAAERVWLWESYSQGGLQALSAFCVALGRTSLFVSSVFHRRLDLCGRYELNADSMDWMIL